MNTLFFIMAVLFIFIIRYVLSREFKKIAELKGHSGRRYFYLTFFLGIWGALAVIALPDIKSTDRAVFMLHVLSEKNKNRT